MKTAVEWLEEKWNNYDLNVGKSGFKLLLKQAKEMENKQIIDAFQKGFITDQWDKTKENKAEQYYNETFKSE